MIWWRGLGIWVLFIVGGVFVASEMISDALFRVAGVFGESLPMGAILLLSGVACYPFGQYTRARQGIVEEGELALDFGHHSLFFIPVHFYPYLLGFVGMGMWAHQVFAL